MINGKIEMQNVWDMYSEIMKEYEIEDAELKKLQDVELEMLADFHNICEETHIKYSLAFGTMLGAVRHQGFIPWDDDVDVMILRKDYDKLVDAVNKNYSKKYVMLDKSTDKDYFLTFPKFVKKGTTLLEPTSEKCPHRGIYIDVFIIDEMPKHCHKIRNKIYRIGYGMAYYASIGKRGSKFFDSIAIENVQFAKIWKTEKRFGNVAKLFTVKFWNSMAKFSTKGIKDKEKLVVSEDNLKALDKSMFANLALYDFDGLKLWGVANYDKYLTDIYGDYMQIPSKENQVRHAIIKLDFGDN